MASYLYNNFASDDNDNYNQKLNAQLNLLDANTDVDKLTQAFAKSFKNKPSKPKPTATVIDEEGEKWRRMMKERQRMHAEQEAKDEAIYGKIIPKVRPPSSRTLKTSQQAARPKPVQEIQRLPQIAAKTVQQKKTPEIPINFKQALIQKQPVTQIPPAKVVPRKQSAKRIIFSDNTKKQNLRPPSGSSQLSNQSKQNNVTFLTGTLIRDEKTQKLLDMIPGVEETKSESSLDSDDLKVSDTELVDQLNGSLSSSEFAQEIKDKVIEHFKKPKQYLGGKKEDSDFDSDLEDVDVNHAMDYYDVLTPTEKLHVIQIRTKKLKQRTNKMIEQFAKWEAAQSSSDEYEDEIGSDRHHSNEEIEHYRNSDLDSNKDSVIAEEKSDYEEDQESTTTTEKGVQQL